MVKWSASVLLCVNGLALAQTNVLLVQQDYTVKTSAQVFHLTVTISSTEVWEREQIIVNVSATTPDLFSSLQQESFRIKGLDIYPIKPTNARIEKDGNKQAELQAGWIIYPIADGQYKIKLPNVQYELNGVIRHSIPIPAFSISVNALPAYIPPTMPVGKITLKQSLSSAALVNTNTLTYWKLQLNGIGLPAHWLPAVLRQIKSNDEIRYSPITSERSNLTDPGGMHSQVIHTIPLKALANGKLELPALRVQYFDPDEGRLKALDIETNNIFALSYIWRIAILLVLGGLLYKTIKLLKTVIHRKWLKRKRIKQALAQICQANTAYAIRTALNHIALAESWPDNLSISAWYFRWNEKYKVQEDLDNLLASLSIACYSNRYIELDADFHSRFISCITKARKI